MNGELTERERRILAMWPRYEDGEPVMPGDRVGLVDGGDEVLYQVHIGETEYSLYTETHDEWHDPGDVVERPARSVLDADGVEIKVGDTVYGVGRSQHSFDVIDPHHIDPEVGEAFSVRCYDRDEGEECHCRPELLTHDLPDSWERLESDAVKGVCEYTGAEPLAFGAHDCDTCRFYGEHGKLICEQLMALDIVRRAKALAGVEVD